MSEAPSATPASTEARSRPLALSTIVLLALLTTQTVAVVWFMTSSLQRADALSGTLSEYLDAQINAGVDEPVLRTDDPLLRTRKVLLFHDVNSHTAKDVSARLMYLDSIDPKAPIDLYISTLGGWSDNAFTIIDTMRTISAPVNIWAVGGCYSSGALILAAATGRRYATEDAMLMIHTNMDDSRDVHSYELLSRERYEHVFRAMTHLPDDWYPMTDDQERYLNPKQALEYQLVDEIVSVWTRKALPTR